MTFDQSLAFLLFALVAAITPGPSNVMIAATGAAVGLARGLPCALGASLGMASLLICSALGLGQLVLGHPGLLHAMNWCGAAFLLWLAFKIATAGRAHEAAAARPVGMIAAAAFQWANPKGWLVAVGAVAAYLQPERSPWLQAATLGALFFAAALPSGLAWLGFGAVMHRLLRDERTARIFNIAMGLALAGSVVPMLW
jgi:threonine/homoserine/homoserine lactone efflux protein